MPAGPNPPTGLPTNQPPAPPPPHTHLRTHQIAALAPRLVVLRLRGCEYVGNEAVERLLVAEEVDLAFTAVSGRERVSRGFVPRPPSAACMPHPP